MINFKIFYDKLLLKYVIVFISLFTALISFFIYFKYINVSIEEQIESEENRTLYLTFALEVDSSKIIDKYKNHILKYECNNNECALTFDKVLSAMKFKNDNISNFENISVNAINNTENNYIIKTVLIFIIIISCIIFLVLLFLFSKNIIYSLRKDIALYKLVGFSNSKIYSIICKFLGTYYLILFIVSIILSNFILYIIMDINIKSQFSYLPSCILVVFLCLLISFFQLAIKIKKITPIEMINDNN